LKEISQFFEGNFGQKKDKKDFLVFQSGSTNWNSKNWKYAHCDDTKERTVCEMFFLNILPKSIDIEVQKHAKRLDDYLLWFAISKFS
jgi:hypothetical protein